MAKLARKINIAIDEDICRDLEKLVPSGKRNKVINDALRKGLEFIRRKKAVNKLLHSVPEAKKYSNRQIISSLTHDRDIH